MNLKDTLNPIREYLQEGGIFTANDQSGQNLVAYSYKAPHLGGSKNSWRYTIEVGDAGLMNGYIETYMQLEQLMAGMSRYAAMENWEQAQEGEGS